MVSLWARFEQLAATHAQEASTALQTRPGSTHLLVKGEQGEPVLLLRCGERDSPRAPIRLRNVSALFDSFFEVRLEAEPSFTERYTRLACEANDSVLRELFVEVASAVVERLPNVLSDRNVDDVIVSLLELFRPAQQAEGKRVLGLWGELAYISFASDKGALVRAWHSQPTELFDFAHQGGRVDVKTTERRVREHAFSLEQLSGREGDVIVSLMTNRSPAGLGVIDLARQVAEGLTVDETERLWQVVTSTLGPAADGTRELKFDLATARASAMSFRAREVPAPVVNSTQMQHVRQVTFVSLLDEAFGASIL